MTRTRAVLIASIAIIAATTIFSSTAAAQGRHGPPPAHVAVYAGYPAYGYGPWFYDPWYAYPFGYPWGYAYAGYPVGYPGTASVRVQVEPRQTEVYVDGYFAGQADNFDGFFQRLELTPGEHQIDLYLEGYRAVHQQVYLQPGTTFRVHYSMQKLAAGEQQEPRPVPQALPPNTPSVPPGPPVDALGRPRPGGEPAAADNAAFGAVSIRVQPGDAEILIDGQVWHSSGSTFVIQLPAGSHRVELRKDGFQTYASSVTVRGGETTPLNVSLSRE